MTNADRVRLARELHDGIAQDLVGVGYSLDLLLANPETSIATRSQLRTLRFTVSDLIDKVRREIYFLRQPSIVSLAQSIQNTAHEHCDGLDLRLSIDEISFHLEAELTYEIHRIAQEILRNITAHAQAHVVTVSLQANSGVIELRITDDGVGGAVATDKRYGIQGIRDRARSINGIISIESNDCGTRISLRIPIAQNAHE